MKRFVGAMLVGTALVCGCGENSPPPDAHAEGQKLAVASTPNAANPPAQIATNPPTPGQKPDAGGMDEVIAKVNGEPMTMRQLVDPLIEAHGLTMLGNLVELELARQNAAKYHVTVTSTDFDDERDRTLAKMFKDQDDPKLVDALENAIAAKNTAEETRLRGELKIEREDYLLQLLLNQHVDPVEFGITLKINTYLRKVLDADWKDKITEEDVKAAFGQMYGERVEVEYIDLTTMKEVTDAQGRLHDGDTFEKVAGDMSHDRLTAAQGGLLPSFAREGPGRIPPLFRETAFALRDGQVSDPLSIGGTFMLIKRIRAIAPKAVKYENERPVVYRKLHDALWDAGLKALKKQLAIEAQSEMKIINPVLVRQVQENADRRAKAEARAKRELDRQEHLPHLHLPGTTLPADTQPSVGTAPATGAAPQAPQAAAGERPPATQPGSAHAFTLPRLGPDTQPSTLPGANK